METRTYIVRMYLRNRQNPARGTVECVRSGKVWVFRNVRELHRLLRATSNARTPVCSADRPGPTARTYQKEE